MAKNNQNRGPGPAQKPQEPPKADDNQDPNTDANASTESETQKENTNQEAQETNPPAEETKADPKQEEQPPAELKKEAPAVDPKEAIKAAKKANLPEIYPYDAMEFTLQAWEDPRGKALGYKAKSGDTALVVVAENYDSDQLIKAYNAKFNPHLVA